MKSATNPRDRVRYWFIKACDGLQTTRRASLLGAALATAVVLGVYYGAVAQTDEQRTLRLAELAVMKSEVAASERTLAQRPVLDAALERARQQLIQARSLLPDESQTGALVAAINAAAERAKVEITSVDARTLTQPAQTAQAPPTPSPTQPTPQAELNAASAPPSPTGAGQLPAAQTNTAAPPMQMSGGGQAPAAQNRVRVQLLRRTLPITVRGNARAVGEFFAYLKEIRPLVIVESCDLRSETNAARAKQQTIEANLMLATYVVPPLVSEGRK